MGKEFYTTIDTMNINGGIGAVKEYEQIREGLNTGINITNEKLNVKTGEVETYLKVNIHNYSGIEYYQKHSDFKKDLIKMMKEYNVNINELNVNRVDISIDTISMSFEKDFKTLLYMFQLLTNSNRKKSTKWIVTDLDDLTTHSIKYYSKRFELEIYDKAKQTNNYSTALSRCEFRYKYLENKKIDDIENLIEKTIDRVELMEKSIEGVTLHMIRTLNGIYDKEISRGDVRNLSEFVRKYNNYIFNKEILEGIYEHSGLKGNVNQWLKKLRKSKDFKLISNNEVVKIQKTITKSLKTFKK